jgi:hypothetical protein
MPRPSLSLSVNTRQPGISGPPPAEKEDFGSLRDAPPSPESVHSFGMGLEGSDMDVPPSPEGQDALCVDLDRSFERRRSFGMGESPSPQSQRSFRMGESPSPQSQHSFGMDSFPAAGDLQDFGMDARPLPEVGVGALPGQGDFGMDSPPPTEAVEPVGSSSAEHGKSYVR